MSERAEQIIGLGSRARIRLRGKRVRAAAAELAARLDAIEAVEHEQWRDPVTLLRQAGAVLSTTESADAGRARSHVAQALYIVEWMAARDQDRIDALSKRVDRLARVL